MSNTQKWTLGCLALAVIVLFGGGAVAFLMLVPEVEEQMPPGVSTFVVTLSTPLNDAQVPLNQFTTVSAEALGVKPITALELWIDGTPSETKNAPPGSTLNQFAASWAWTPASEGEHTLLVRAIDADTTVGMSNIVRVTASQDVNVVPSGAYETKPGDTAASVAQQAKTFPQQILDLNPQVNPSGTITPGEVIAVPIPPPLATETPTPEPPPSPVPPSDPGDPPKGPPNKNIVWIGSLISKFGWVTLPALPGLTASVGAGTCSIDLYIDDKSDNEEGFYLYRLDPNTFGFEHIATLDAHSGPKPIHYVDPVSTGKYQYYVAAFNAAGKSDSKIVKSAIIEPCGSPQQGLKLDKGKVTVKQPVDKIYCYLSVDNGPWTRIPPGVNAFITPTKPGEFDVSQYLKSLTPSPPPPKITLHLECWGWQGNTLIFLGEATETIGQGPVQVIGNDFQLVGNLSAVQLSGSVPSANIARPLNARITLDPKECVQYASPNPLVQAVFAILCQGAADKGYQFLVWDWSPNGCSSGNCIKDTDGYHVYVQYIANPPTLVDTISDRSHHVSILPPKSAPMFPPVFFARAFKGAVESEDSNQAQSKQTQAKMTLPAESTAWRNVQQHAWYSGPVPGCLYTKGLGPPTVGSGEILVGHSRWYDSGAVCWERLDQYYRGAIWFDISKIKGNIVDARLQYRWASGEYSPDPKWATSQKLSCATSLLLGAEDWRGKDYGDQPVTIPGGDYMALDGALKLYYNSNTNTKEAFPFEVDVTSAVKQWKLGKPNYGFVFRGNDESLSIEHNDWCYSRYTDFSLKVNYQPTGQ